SDDLALGRTLACPAARLEILLEGLDRRTVVALVLDIFVAQDQTPGLDFLAARLAAAVAGADPPILASSSASRAFRDSFSSRAAAAMALTASNSSRPTKSLPAIHSRIFSR